MRGPWTLDLDGRKAAAIELGPEDGADAVPRALGLPTGRPTVAIVGGAATMSGTIAEAARLVLARAVVPVVQALDGVVVDGGTDAGVMRAAGEARAEQEACFPLVGVVVAQLLQRTAGDPPGTASPEPRHSHFVLVPGNAWGDESAWLAAIAGALADTAPSITLLINGGEIAWQDVEASITSGRPVLALAGSGRTADSLAAAMNGQSTEERASTLAASGLVRLAPFKAADEVEAALRRELVPPTTSAPNA